VIANAVATPATKLLAGVGYEPGSPGMIVAMGLVDSANQATALVGEIWLFNADLAARDVDNGAFTPTDADLEDNLIGIITLPTPIDGDATAGAGGNTIYWLDDVSLLFKCADTSKDIYWELVARNAYTPVALEKFTLFVEVVQSAWFGNSPV
jgi:hypothetical protein